MSMDDRSKTTPRQFQCRDRLWQTFEQISEDQDKSIEELINDAMSSYAQLAGYETAVSVDTPGPTPEPVSAPLPAPARLPVIPSRLAAAAPLTLGAPRCVPAELVPGGC